MAAILGVSAFFHDAAACLLVDDNVVAAAQEERFSRLKHDSGFPEQAIQYCLREGQICANELDGIAFYEKPLQKFDRLLESSLATAPRGYRAFAAAMPSWLTGKLNLRKTIRRRMRALAGEPFTGKIEFVDHHLSHAASAFLTSDHEQSAILCCDAVGEWTTTSLGLGQGNEIHLNRCMKFPHSLGLLYSAFTHYCGFRVNSGEYKLMGLAPYGEPRFTDLITERLMSIQADGSFRLRLDHFGYVGGLSMTNERFHRLFGRPPREPGSEIEPFHQDVAASIQRVTEEVLLKTVEFLHQQTGQRNLCLAGGVALNCVANGRIQRECSFDHLHVPPWPGDAGGAIGAASVAAIRHGSSQSSRRTQPTNALKHEHQIKSGLRRFHAGLGFLGSKYDDALVRDQLQDLNLPHHWLEGRRLSDEVAGLLASGRIIGWMQGAMEFGPRALGNRSILADPRLPDMQLKLNQAIKFRESFRPFAPVVLAEHVHEYFEVESGYHSPSMSFIVKRRPEANPVSAVTHVDGTSRIQTLRPEDNPRLHELLLAFYQATECPMLVNTSFNVRGEPIVRTVLDAYRCFQKSGLDALVVGRCLLLKSEQGSEQ